MPDGAAITRPSPDDRPAAIIRRGGLEIDHERYLVTFAGRPVPLTYMEFHVLLEVAKGHGRVVTYDALAQALWDGLAVGARRRLAVLVSRIRSKLGDGAGCIDTVHRVGYRLAPAAGGAAQSEALARPGSALGSVVAAEGLNRRVE